MKYFISIHIDHIELLCEQLVMLLTVLKPGTSQQISTVLSRTVTHEWVIMISKQAHLTECLNSGLKWKSRVTKEFWMFHQKSLESMEGQEKHQAWVKMEFSMFHQTSLKSMESQEEHQVQVTKPLIRVSSKQSLWMVVYNICWNLKMLPMLKALRISSISNIEICLIV